MTVYKRDPEDVQRDLVIAAWHPTYADGCLIESLRQLKRDRGEYV